LFQWAGDLHPTLLNVGSTPETEIRALRERLLRRYPNEEIPTDPTEFRRWANQKIDALERLMHSERLPDRYQFLSDPQLRHAFDQSIIWVRGSLQAIPESNSHCAPLSEVVRVSVQ
jgi:hypothetical protein